MTRHTGDYVLTAQELSIVSGGANVGKCITYTVVKGDSLARIARRYGTSVQRLSELNRLREGGTIYIGQALLIPIPD